jgi:hypothetical protein
MVVVRVLNKWIIVPLPLVQAGGWRRVAYSSGALVAALLAREEVSQGKRSDMSFLSNVKRVLTNHGMRGGG